MPDLVTKLWHLNKT